MFGEKLQYIFLPVDVFEYRLNAMMTKLTLTVKGKKKKRLHEITELMEKRKKKGGFKSQNVRRKVNLC